MLSCKSHLVPLYKVVKNDKGKSYVKGFCVKPKDLTVKREKQRFNTKDANTDSFGRYKAERVALHQRITVNIVNSCPKPKEGERPKVILLMGGAASGKSTIVKKYLEPKYGSHTFGVLNVDDIKEELPEYQKFASEDVETSANRVHEESSDIGKQVLRRIISEKRNFIYDAVLGNVQKANKIIDDLYFLGYDIELVGVTVNTEQAWERAVKRAIGENEKEDGSGRYIPEQPFFNGHRGIVETFEKFNRNKVDKYYLFDNNVNFGDDPILIEDNEGVKDEERKVEFLKKRNIYPELKKGAVPLYEFLLGYDILRKAFDYGSTTSEVFYKATKVIKNITDNLDARQSITFGDEEYRNISVNDLMEVIADNTDTIHYCDAIVTNQKGELLIIQRTSFDSLGAGKWCTPGGKVDQGEFLHQAVKRELLEETGLVATNCNYTCLYKNDDGSYSHYFWCYVDDYSQLYVDANEIQQYNWISPSNAYKYDFLLDCADRIMEIFNIPFKGKFLTKQELDAIASNKIEKAYTETSLETSYEKGCLMLDIDWVNRHGINKWHEILSKIDRDDVYEEAGYGLETKPHITILYGFKLPTVTPEHIERLLPDGAVTFKIKDVNFFEAEDYDVLKFEIESEMLHELNLIYKVLEHENKFPDYNPHITIAYLKKGCAKKFANHYRALFADWINYQFQSTKFDYSFNDDYGKKAKAHWDVKGFETIEDSPEDKILKAKQYQIGEISQTTGMKKVAPGKWVDPKTGKPAKGEDEKGNEGKKNESLANRELSDEELAEHAKHASESDLQNVIKNNRNPKLREFAQLELSRRKKEETPKEEKTDLKKTPEDNKEYQRDTMVKDILGALDSFIGDEFLISIQRPLEREFIESNKIYSEEERQKFFANLPTKRISLSSIKLVQGRVNKELVEKKRGRPKNLEPIHLFKIGDQYQVWDGNHRAIASILNGEKAIDAKVVDMTQNLKEENFKYHLDNDQRDTFIKGKDKFFKEKDKKEPDKPDSNAKSKLEPKPEENSKNENKNAEKIIDYLRQSKIIKPSAEKFYRENIKDYDFKVEENNFGGYNILINKKGTKSGSSYPIDNNFLETQDSSNSKNKGLKVSDTINLKEIGHYNDPNDEYAQDLDEYLKSDGVDWRKESSIERLDPSKIKASEWNDSTKREGNQKVEKYKKMDASNMPPIIAVRRGDGTIEAINGIHRVWASSDLGLKVPAIVINEKLEQSLSTSDTKMEQFLLNKYKNSEIPK